MSFDGDEEEHDSGDNEYDEDVKEEEVQRTGSDVDEGEDEEQWDGDRWEKYIDEAVEKRVSERIEKVVFSPPLPENQPEKEPEKGEKSPKPEPTVYAANSAPFMKGHEYRLPQLKTLEKLDLDQTKNYPQNEQARKMFILREWIDDMIPRILEAAPYEEQGRDFWIMWHGVARSIQKEYINWTKQVAVAPKQANKHK